MYTVRISNAMNLNQDIFIFINSIAFKYAWLDKLLVFLANDFGIILCFIALIFFMLHRDTDVSEYAFSRIKRKLKEFIVITSSVVGSWVLVSILKIVFSVPRPVEALEGVRSLIIYGTNDSFPSGHATFFASLAMALYLYHKKLGILFFIGALLVGFSRIAVGIHYPIDIIGGYVLGLGTSFFLYKFFKFLSRKYL